MQFIAVPILVTLAQRMNQFEQTGLAVPCQSRQPDNFALERLERQTLCQQTRLDLQLPSLMMTGRRLFVPVSVSLPHRLNHALRTGLRGVTFVDDRTLAHHDDAIAVVHDLVHFVRNQYTDTAAAYKVA